MLRGLIAVLICLAVAGAACSSAGVPEVPTAADGTRDAELVTGREIYARRCANCHGNDGGGGRGTKLANGAAVSNYPAIAEQITVISEGVRAMPAFGSVLTSAEIMAVARYIREVL